MCINEKYLSSIQIMDAVTCFTAKSQISLTAMTSPPDIHGLHSNATNEIGR